MSKILTTDITKQQLISSKQDHQAMIYYAYLVSLA